MVVLDASAVIEYLLDAARHPRIGEIIRHQRLHAPHLIDIEVLHAFRSAVIGHRMTEARVVEAISDFHELRIERHAHDPLLERIWHLRNNITAYDASYVALAERLGLPLLTRDRRLSRTSGHHARIEYID